MTNLYCVLPLVLLIGFASYASTPGSLSNRAVYSAEDIFKSIFFAEGNFAESIPELSQFNIRNFTTEASVINKAMQDQQQIVNVVNSQHPGYMASLKNAVASGDHIRIQQAMQEGGQYVKDAYTALNPEVDEEAQNELAADFANHVDINNATPGELRQAISEYVNSGNSNPLAIQACVALAIVVVVLLALLLVIPAIAVGNEIEATLANEMIVNAIANSAGK